MSLAAEHANAARWMNAQAARLPETALPNLSLHWADLEDRIEGSRSEGAAELAILEWRAEMEQLFAVRLAHSPLEES
jgi:hypothetical protein